MKILFAEDELKNNNIGINGTAVVGVYINIYDINDQKKIKIK